MTTPTMTKCPDWCTDHTNPGHPEDEQHAGRFDGALIEFRLFEYVVDPPREGVGAHFYVTQDEGAVSTAQLRQLSAAALAAADALDAATTATAASA